MYRAVVLDGHGQFGDTAEYAVADAVGRYVAKETLDHVQPRCRGWCEMNVESPVFGDPFRMLVGGVVVADQMKCSVLLAAHGRFGAARRATRYGGDATHNGRWPRRRACSWQQTG